MRELVLLAPGTLTPDDSLEFVVQDMNTAQVGTVTIGKPQWFGQVGYMRAMGTVDAIGLVLWVVPDDQEIVWEDD